MSKRLSSKVFIIAEAGVNHNGNIDMAKKLIDVACEAKVDAIKFQTFKAEKLVTANAQKAAYQKINTKNDDSQLEMLKKLEFSFEQFRILYNYCNDRNIMFLSTPFDFESAEFLNCLGVDIIKVGSGDITNIPFLKYLAKSNKEIMLSTGMSNLGEVEDAIDAIRSEGNDNITLLHCTSSYPAKYDSVNLKSISTLKHAFGLPVGYSDHTEGIEVSMAAVAIGACVIEKHFTLDKSLDGPDHKASLEPLELKNLVKGIRNVEASMGDGIKKCTDSEKDVRIAARKSIVAKENIKKGHIILEEDMDYKRPGDGLKPNMNRFIIGKKAKRDIYMDEKISFDMIE